MENFFTLGLDHWQIWFLISLFIAVIIVTVINVLYFRRSVRNLSLSKQTSYLSMAEQQKIGLSSVRHQGPDPNNESLLSDNQSLLQQPMLSVHVPAPKPLGPNTNIDNKNDSYQALDVSSNKSRVIKFCASVLWVPMALNGIALYATMFPKQGVLIFPILNIVCGLLLLVFMRTLVIACDGWFVLQHYLEPQTDICCVQYTRSWHRHRARKKSIIKFKSSNKALIKALTLQKTAASSNVSPNTGDRTGSYVCCNCLGCTCVKSNAYKGLKWKMKMCHLILLPPMLNYITLYFRYYRDSEFISYASMVCTVLIAVVCAHCAIVIHAMLSCYAKISHTRRKLLFVLFLSPFCQLQQCLIEFVCHFDLVQSDALFHSGLPANYAWICVYGVLLCVQLFLVTIVMAWKIFSAEDLELWNKLDELTKSSCSSEISINIGVTVESDTELSVASQ